VKHHGRTPKALKNWGIRFFNRDFGDPLGGQPDRANQWSEACFESWQESGFENDFARDLNLGT
jgi:hypothetical protein